MLMFDFYCTHCQQQFEELVHSQEDLDTVNCPGCKGHEVKPLPAAAKGSKVRSSAAGLSSPAPACSPTGGFS